MRPIRIIGYIIEIIIAIALFVVLAQKTPLFERVIPWRSSGFSSVVQSQSPTTSKETNNINSWSTAITTSWTTITSMNNPIPLAVQSFWKSCTTPWGESVANQQSIIAYSSTISDTSNTCISEIRTCNKWKLSWSYQYKVCDFFIDGKRNGKEVIVWANDSQQQFWTEATKLQARLKANKEYIQPKSVQDRNRLTYADTQWRGMENSTIPIKNKYNTDILDQEIIRHDHTQESTGSCITPRGESINHGKVIYAYNTNTATANNSCLVEQRSCKNGKLSGTYQYKSCNGTSLSNSSSTTQTTAWTENNRLWQIQRSLNDNSTISPWGPQSPRSINDAVNDPVKLSSLPISTSSSNNNTQNYIAFEDCADHACPGQDITPPDTNTPPTSTNWSGTDSRRDRTSQSIKTETKKVTTAINNTGKKITTRTKKTATTIGDRFDTTFKKEA